VGSGQAGRDEGAREIAEALKRNKATEMVETLSGFNELIASTILAISWFSLRGAQVNLFTLSYYLDIC
jgi:hypothetical protein